ncbi:hypothetical protein BZA77DRAFT_296222 [Pyronema omphalodes]|nr:hypothetical protein BZA77DRAFT_296222 [Pyronema omphalodes]
MESFLSGLSEAIPCGTPTAPWTPEVNLPTSPNTIYISHSNHDHFFQLNNVAVEPQYDDKSTLILMPDWSVITICPEHEYCSGYLPPYDGTIQNVWTFQIPEFPEDEFHLPQQVPYEWLMQPEPDPNVPLPTMNAQEANFEFEKFLGREWMYADDQVPEGCSKDGPDKFDPNWRPWCEKKKSYNEGLAKRIEKVPTTLVTVTKATQATPTPVPENHGKRNLRAQMEDFDAASYQSGDITQLNDEGILPIAFD